MILLLGGSGYIGQVFETQLTARRYMVVRGSRREYTNFGRLADLIRATRADLVINCAAFVTKPSVDLCEDHKVECVTGNLLLPAIIAYACQVTNTPLMHVSTGCLFNGDNGGKGYSETDPPQLTLNTGAGIYVSSKEAAEHSVRQWPQSYICRIRIPFDFLDHERNYLSKLQRYPKVYDNRNSLSHRGDFVNACLDLWENSAPYGTYNVTNPGSITARQICAMIALILGKRSFEFWDEEEFMQKVARTKKSNCVLNVQKLLSTGVKIRDVQDAVEDSLRNWVPEKTGQQAAAAVKAG